MILAVRSQHHEAEEAEQVAWRYRYDDQVKDAPGPEKEPVESENDGRGAPDDLEEGLANAVSLD